jgi:hypothetical protein
MALAMVGVLYFRKRSSTAGSSGSIIFSPLWGRLLQAEDIILRSEQKLNQSLRDWVGIGTCSPALKLAVTQGLGRYVYLCALISS